MPIAARVPIVVARVARSTNNSPGGFHYSPTLQGGLLLHNRATSVVEVVIVVIVLLLLLHNGLILHSGTTSSTWPEAYVHT